VHLEAGEVRWGYADTHSVRNLIDQRAEFIVIELKDSDQKKSGSR
jgi:hypothetical protein